MPRRYRVCPPPVVPVGVGEGFGEALGFGEGVGSGDGLGLGVNPPDWLKPPLPVPTAGFGGVGDGEGVAVGVGLLPDDFVIGTASMAQIRAAD